MTDEDNHPVSDLIEPDDFHVAEQAFVDGDLTHALEHLGPVLVNAPERRDARERFSRITAEAADPLSLVPLTANYVGTVALRALLCARIGKADDAVSLLLQCVQALPDSRLLLWLQEWTANPSFVQSLDIDATAFGLHRLAFEITNPQRYVELLDAIENLRLIHPRHERLAYVHVFSLRRRERFDEAVTVAREMFADSETYEWVVALGATYRDAGMLDDAAAMYERAVEIDDSDASIFLDIGDVRLEKGSVAQAIAAYESALEREPDQPWALASLAFARFRETGDPVYLDDLADRAADGDERAAALENLALPYFGYLPRPTDATFNLLEQLADDGVTRAGAITNFKLSHIESPSSRMAADVFANTRVDVAIQIVPPPDPRLPWADVAFTLWRYDGTDPSAALEPPQRADVVDAVVAIADSAFHADAWYAAACDANLIARDEETLRELLAVMVHPPVGDHARPWIRIQRVQFASAMLIASLDRATAWQSSLRRRGLHALVHGPLDWTTEAALVALTTAVRAGDADEKEALRWMKALYQRRPSDGAWLVQQALLASMLRMPSLDAGMRDRLREERRMLTLDDDDYEPADPPPSKKKPFWKRWLGL